VETELASRARMNYQRRRQNASRSGIAKRGKGRANGWNIADTHIQKGGTSSRKKKKVSRKQKLRRKREFASPCFCPGEKRGKGELKRGEKRVSSRKD